MGLDLIAYRNINRVDSSTIAFDEYGVALDENVIEVYWCQEQEEAFPGSTDNLMDGYYSFEACISRHMGSYSFYGNFRNLLEKFAEDIGSENAFQDIIFFSDCEGFFGITTCQRLFDDFNKYRTAFFEWVKSNVQSEAYRKEFIDAYDRAADIFDFALHGGFVQFC